MKNLAYRASLPLRRVMPEKAKVVLRLLKLAITPYPQAAPVIPQHLLDGCRFISTREHMLDYLPKQSVAGEIGTLYGNFSKMILEKCQPKTLHLFDLNFSDLRKDVADSPAIKQHKGHSARLLQDFEDEYFDWLYIDGDHSYEGVKADIEAAKSKIKPGGLLVFNDFAKIVPTGFGTFGVHQAVSEFAVNEQWKFIYFCFQSNALYDVALQRPL